MSQELQKTALRDIVALTEDGTINDILDTIQKGVDLKKDWDKSAYQSKSIAKRAANLVLVFPVIVSTAIKVETAILISKAIERKCVSLLQLLFSTRSFYSNDTQDVYDYIKKFHTNLGSTGPSISLDDFINIMGAVRHESTMADPMDKEIYDRVMTELRQINTAAKTLLRESSVNDYKIQKNRHTGRTMVTLEAGGNQNNNSNPNRGSGGGTNRQDSTTRFHDTAKDQAGFLPAQIVSSDVSKANELVPTMMMVNFITVRDGVKIDNVGMVGVKAKMYPVDSMELIGRLSSKYTDGDTLFSLIKVSTAEKGFFKDLLFAFEKTKWDAVNIAKGSVNSKLFRTLERRAQRNKRILLKKGDASPITTVVLTQDEVEYLKKYSNVDIEKPAVAMHIFSGYNLMGLVIADESIEVAKFLYDDGDATFESLPYSALAKEDKNGDYKKIVNLLTRIR